jgi:hypothetical protein
LLVAGDALRHDARGRPEKDFALAREMGVSYVGTIRAKHGLSVEGKPPAGELPVSLRIREAVETRPLSGQTLLTLHGNGRSCPLLHVNTYGKGKIAYLASLDSVELTQNVMNWLAGPPPVTVSGPGDPQVVLTHQPRQQRWILHLISGGDYTIAVRQDHVPAKRVGAAYPKGNWTWKSESLGGVLRLGATGPADDRMLILE